MEKKKITVFLFVSIALLMVAVLLKTVVTGMSVADFSETTAGASMLSGIFLFAFIMGLLVFVESERPDESIDEITNTVYEKAVAEGRPLSEEDRRTILAAQLVDYSRRNAVPDEYHKYNRSEDPNYRASMEDRSRIIKEQIEGEKPMYEKPKEKDDLEYRRQLFMQSAAEKLRSYKK